MHRYPNGMVGSLWKINHLFDPLLHTALTPWYFIFLHLFFCSSPLQEARGPTSLSRSRSYIPVNGEKSPDIKVTLTYFHSCSKSTQKARIQCAVCYVPCLHNYNTHSVVFLNFTNKETSILRGWVTFKFQRQDFSPGNSDSPDLCFLPTAFR